MHSELDIRRDRAARAAGVMLLFGGLAACTLIINALPVKYSVGLITAVSLVIGILIYPATGLLLLAFSIPFGSLYPLSIGPFKLDASDLLVLLTAVSWFFRWIVVYRQPLRGGRWMVALAFFLYIATFGLVPATDMAEALKELLKWLEFGLILWITVQSGDSPSIIRITAALLCAGMLQGLYGIYQFSTSGGPEAFTFLGSHTRAYGTFEQPNPFGGYMGLLLPIAFSYLVTHWKDAFAARRNGGVNRILFWWFSLVSACVMLTALLMSGSRGALLGFAAGLGAIFLCAGKKVLLLLALFGVILLMVGPALLPLVPQAYLERITDIFILPSISNLGAIEVTDANYSLLERAAHWQAAWRMFASRPWFGVGLGQYNAAYPAVAVARWDNPLGHAHNYILNTLAEGGIVGVASFLVLQVSLLAAGLHLALSRGHPERWIGLASVGLWAALFTHNLFDNLFVHYLQLVVAVVFGMVIAAAHLHTAQRQEV